MNENSSELQPMQIEGKRVNDERLSRRLPNAAAVLRRANVVYVRIDYRGEWDVGMIDDPAFYSGDRKRMDLSLPARRLELHLFFHELLELRYPGWQNAEGSQGQFEWDLIPDLLTHVHGWRTSNLTITATTG